MLDRFRFEDSTLFWMFWIGVVAANLRLAGVPSAIRIVGWVLMIGAVLLNTPKAKPPDYPGGDTLA